MQQGATWDEHALHVPWAFGSCEMACVIREMHLQVAFHDVTGGYLDTSAACSAIFSGGQSGRLDGNIKCLANSFRKAFDICSRRDYSVLHIWSHALKAEASCFSGGREENGWPRHTASSPGDKDSQLGIWRFRLNTASERLSCP